MLLEQHGQQHEEQRRQQPDTLRATAGQLRSPPGILSTDAAVAMAAKLSSASTRQVTRQPQASTRKVTTRPRYMVPKEAVARGHLIPNLHKSIDDQQNASLNLPPAVVTPRARPD